MKALGQEHSDARLCLEELLKKVEEVSTPNVSSRPPDVSVAEAHANLWHWAQTTPKKGESWRRHCRRSEPAQQWHLWGSDWTSARNIAGRQASRKSTGSGDRGAEGSDSEGGGVGGGAAPFGDTSCRGCCPARTKPPHDARDRRVGPIAETGRADGRRVEVESPSSLEEHGGEQFETSSGTAHVGGGILESRNGTGPCGSRSGSALMSDLIDRLVTARYGHRGVRLGEARNPGPPKRLRRVPNRHRSPLREQSTRFVSSEQGQFPAFKCFTDSPGVFRRSSSGIGGGRAGDSSTDRIPGSRPGCTVASHRKGSGH